MYCKTVTVSFSESVEILTVDKMFLHSACSALEQFSVMLMCIERGNVWGEG